MRPGTAEPGRAWGAALVTVLRPCSAPRLLRLADSVLMAAVQAGSGGRHATPPFLSRGAIAVACKGGAALPRTPIVLQCLGAHQQAELLNCSPGNASAISQDSLHPVLAWGVSVCVCVCVWQARGRCC